jgi:organic radical activating enzyme
VTTDAILEQLDAMGVDMVVITGGEPLLQQRDLAALIDALRVNRGWRVEIETAGTIAPALDVDQWNVSPKLENSGNRRDRRYKPDVLRAFQATGRAAFKFVVTEVEDLDEITAIVDECALDNVWLMPEGIDAAALDARLAWIAPAAIERGWNVTTRLHVVLWGNERGR